MNEITKLILTFLAGLVVGVLGATSTLFQGEPEPSPSEIVTSKADRERGQSPGERVEPGLPVEQPAPESGSSELEAEAPQARAEPNLVQTEPPQSNVEAAEQDTGDDGEMLMPVEPEAEDKIFCMLMENTGRCQCYDAATMAPADVSAEECREQLAEE